MSLRVFTLEDKIRAIETEIMEARGADRPPGSLAQRHYELLKSIAADLRARKHLPRNNALGELELALDLMKRAPRLTAGYNESKMIAVTNIVISKWPVISQALEQFGEESAE